KHPEPKPFATTRLIDNFRDAVLQVADVSNFDELRRFLGMAGPSPAPATDSLAGIAAYLRETFYPNVKTSSHLGFLREPGILGGVAEQPDSTREILFRLIDKKSAFEWQQGVLTEWDGMNMKLLVGGQPRTYRLSPDAPIFQRIGDDRIAMQNGSWI